MPSPASPALRTRVCVIPAITKLSTKKRTLVVEMGMMTIATHIALQHPPSILIVASPAYRISGLVTSTWIPESIRHLQLQELAGLILPTHLSTTTEETTTLTHQHYLNKTGSICETSKPSSMKTSGSTVHDARNHGSIPASSRGFVANVEQLVITRSRNKSLSSCLSRI